MDKFIGQIVEGKVVKHPTHYVNGRECSRENLLSATRVDLGRGYFYLLPPGMAFSPNHAKLEEHVGSPLPASRSRPKKDAAPIIPD